MSAERSLHSEPPEFPAQRWRYIDRLLASYGHPRDKAGRKWLRELRDRAVTHELALREIADTEWGDVAHEVNGPNELALAALGEKHTSGERGA